MHPASNITGPAAAPRPAPEPVSFVDVNVAANLLCDFLNALEDEGPQRDVWIEYARARAEYQLALWGVDRRPIFGAGVA